MATDVSLPETKRLASQLLESNETTREKRESSLLEVMVALGERKRIIISITAAFALIAMILSYVLPAEYTATTTILPPQQSNSMNSMLASQLGNLEGIAALSGSSLGVKNPNDMFVAMLRSRTVEDAMIHQFNLMEVYNQKYESEGRKAFERRTKIDGSGKDGLIHIAVEDRDPRRAAMLANGYVDQFRTLTAGLAISEASQRRLFFEQQLEHAKDDLANAEEAMKRTELQTGLIQLDSQARSLIESAASLRAQIAAKEVQIESMRTYATGQNSQLVQAQQELDGLRLELAKLDGSESGLGAGLMVPKGTVPEAGLEYSRKLRDVKYYETIFQILARQFEAAKLDEAKQGALVQVIDRAVPPDRRSSPKRAIMVILASAIGFFVSILYILIRIRFEQVKNDSDTGPQVMAFLSSLSLRRPRGRPSAS
jgi:tyrosine-protein kinase Etk/Wzc